MSEYVEPHEVEWLRADLIRVPLRTPTIPPATRTNTYLVRTDAGWFCVDPGSPHEEELMRLQAAIDGLPGGRDALSGWILTHHHPDHWGGLVALLEVMPRPVVVQDPSRYTKARTWTLWSPADFAANVEGPALLHTPGHSSDHLVIWLDGGDVIAGDLVAGLGTVVINPPDGNMADYFRSLERLLEGHDGTPVRKLFPAHGPVVEDGEARLRSYLHHREARELEVLEALDEAAAGGEPFATPEVLVPGIYVDVPEALHGFAARSVLAHLLKLEEEGRVERRRDAWRRSRS